MKIAVVGGGNGSYTMAGDCALAGHSVRMWPGVKQKHAELYRQGTILLEGLGRTGEARLELVSDDPAEVVKGAEVILCTDPAYTQAKRASVLAAHLENGQVVFLSPGSLGPLVFEKTLRAEGRRTDLSYAEPGTLPYLTRKVEPTKVQVSGLAAHLPVGVFPARNTKQVLERLTGLYPAAHPVENALSVALLNVGPIIHSVLFLLNTGAIEHFPAWDIHNEGTTQSVKKLVLAHDAERIALRKILGYDSHHYPFEDHYNPAGDAEWMYGKKAHTDLVKSEKWRESLNFEHRYIVEDVKCNLALMASVGDLCRMETPIADALLTLIGAICGEDFRKTGRTLETLGVGDLSVEELTTLVWQGFDDGPEHGFVRP
ncbi:MAG: NAD/NADP octopine/nopaline dehydrogenase family protein [Desulfobacterales bacterium]|nr:MAG: NAD/NADP octopine/nopaline dehydrogenase family protein [Desulfobacterales bacterium]